MHGNTVFLVHLLGVSLALVEGAFGFSTLRIIKKIQL
jgi:hypothetical protein